MNQITLTGHVGAKPEVRFTQRDNTKVAEFRLAVQRPTGSNVQESEPDWFTCEAWGKQADVAEAYLDKGSQVAVVGSLRMARWQTQQGEKREKPVVKVGLLELLGRPRGQEQSGGGGEQPAAWERSRRPAPSRQPEPAANLRPEGVPF